MAGATIAVAGMVCFLYPGQPELNRWGQLVSFAGVLLYFVGRVLMVRERRRALREE